MEQLEQCVLFHWEAGRAKGEKAGRQRWTGRVLVSIASVGPSDAASKIAPGVHSVRMQCIARWSEVGSWVP